MPHGASASPQHRTPSPLSPGSDPGGPRFSRPTGALVTLATRGEQEDLNGRDDVTGARLYLLGLPVYAGVLYLLGQWANL